MKTTTSNLKASMPFETGIKMIKKNRGSARPIIMGFALILFTSFSIIGCTGNNKSTVKTDTTAQSNAQRDDDGSAEVYRGMEMIKAGNDMVNKGEKANDRTMIDNGVAEMEKGMDMIRSGRGGVKGSQPGHKGMDDKMAMGDSAAKSGVKDMDMGDNGMAMIHQGLDVAKSGKMVTMHAQKNKDRPMMQTGMDMMDKGMAMITMGKEMMGKDGPAMSDKPMADDMDMMDKGMDMMDKGKGMAAKAMGPPDKPMMDDDMMDKGMDMMDKGMGMMGMGADKMKKDKKPMPKKDAPMTDM